MKTKIIAIASAVVVAIGTYFASGDVSLALKVAFDKEAATAECAKLINAE